MVNKVIKWFCGHFGHKWTRRIKDGRWEQYCSKCGLLHKDKNK